MKTFPLISTIIIIIFAYKEEKILPFSWDHVKAIIASLITVFIIYKIIKIIYPVTPPWTLIPGFIIAAIIYISLLFLFRAIKKEDKEIIMKVKRKVLG